MMPSLVAESVKNLSAKKKKICLQCRRPGLNPWVRNIPWRKKWQSHSSILAWEISWIEEPHGLQSMGSQKSRAQLSD